MSLKHIIVPTTIFRLMDKMVAIGQADIIYVSPLHYVTFLTY